MKTTPFSCAHRWLGPRVLRATYSTNSAPSQSISAVLSKPTWSVRSLLPSTEPGSSSSSSSSSSPISPTQLRHLLRLSSLPPPKTPADEQRMIDTLRDQLHFVRGIQAVDTSGVEPLAAIRDETASGRRDATIDLNDPAIVAVLGAEEKFGHYGRRKRRKDEVADTTDSHQATSDWDVLGTAGETAGRYFVVRTGKTTGQTM